MDVDCDLDTGAVVIGALSAISVGTTTRRAGNPLHAELAEEEVGVDVDVDSPGTNELSKATWAHVGGVVELAVSNSNSFFCSTFIVIVAILALVSRFLSSKSTMDNERAG